MADVILQDRRTVLAPRPEWRATGREKSHPINVWIWAPLPIDFVLVTRL